MSALKKSLRTPKLDSAKIEKLAHCERAKATQKLIESFKSLFQF